MYNSLNNDKSPLSTDSDEQSNLNTIKPSHKKTSRCDCCCNTTNGFLIFLIIFLLILVIGFAGLAVILKFRLHDDTCTSPQCFIMAGEILGRMNLEADPCEDFYEYSCGAYIKDENRSPDTSIRSMFSDTERKILLRIKTILDQADDENSSLQNSTAVKKAGRFYKACMRDDFVGTNALISLIEDMGGWPLAAGRWDPNTWNFEEALSKALVQAEPLIDLGLSANERNISEYIIYLSQAGLAFSSKVFTASENITNKYHAAYIAYFKDICHILGVRADILEKIAEDVWEFEKALAGAFVSPENMIDPNKLYNLMTVEEFQKILDVNNGKHVINIQTLLSKQMKRSVSLTETIVVQVPGYFRKKALLVNSVHSDTLASYLVWSMLRDLAPHAGGQYKAATDRFSIKLSGATESKGKWEQCLDRTITVVGFATAGLYVEKYFSDTDKDNIVDIMKNIFNELAVTVPRQDWMNDQVRRVAKEKVSALETLIGYPDFITKPETLDQYYENLSITDNPLQNVINYQLFLNKRNRERYGTVPDKTEWSKKPTEANAYYRPTFNQIVIPAGILQRPFYDKYSPASVVYGATGFFVAHELIHGFDAKGRKYDVHGNMANWWDDESALRYEVRSQCFVDQYNNYTINDLHINGLVTLNENIADNGGLNIAYSAYMTWRKTHDDTFTHNAAEKGSKITMTDARLPGLNITSEQQFFLSYAQIWCESYTKDALENAVRSGDHTVKKFRVNGVIMNSPKFSEAYKCRSSDPMNPEKRCKIW